MNDLDLLYRAILTSPAEDVPRLAYADALDERGAPGDADRAEFIRVQIELERRLPTGQIVELKDIYAASDLMDRQSAAFNDHRYINWLPSFMHTGPGTGVRVTEQPFVDLFGNGFVRVGFVRGFLRIIEVEAETFLLHASALLWNESQQRPVPATAQPITRVVLHGIPAADDRHMRALAKKQRFDWYPTDTAGQPTAHQFALDAFRAEWPGVQFEYAPNIST